MFKSLKSVLERIIRLHGKLMENVLSLRLKRCQKLNPNQCVLYPACSFQIGMLFSLLDFSGSRRVLLYSLFFRVEGMLVPVLYPDAA